MNDPTKSVALNLIKLAIVLVPAIEVLVRKAVDAITSDDPPEVMAIADEVRAILPEQSESGKAMVDLYNQGKGI